MLKGTNLQVMKKKKGPTPVAVCLVVFISIFFLDAIITIFRSSVTYTIRTEEKKLWESNTSRPRHTTPSICDRFDYYDICHLTSPIILDPTTATIFVEESINPTPPSSERIRPYPHKFQESIMPLIKELTLTTAPPNTSCGVTHSTPALIYSAGGYTGNFFHDLSDGFIPLFITINSHFPDKDVILAIVDYRDWWPQKYADLFPHFTRHPIINLDKETTAHCFPSAIVGLITHGPMTVDPRLLPGPHPKTMLDFRDIIANTYGQGYTVPYQQIKAQPKLVLLNRRQTRRILNIDEVRRAISGMGFDVIEFEPSLDTPLHESFRLFDTSHGMIGVHGQGLTHALFLRPGAVFIQVVPIGLSWLAHNCYKKIAPGVGLDYMEYEVEVQESSLAGKYASDSLELKDPGAIINGNFSKMHPYMTQDVKLDILRFNIYLKKAYEKAKKFMIREHLSVERKAKTTKVTVESF